ncbi:MULTISPECIES: DUF3836 domain-containing protein [Parabacteroides]|jgi:hypothetical protein|uniref:DUF3836 domain-containing protein n=1 Tax=Parabacteroides TaxID=375288 RepID=UPI000EFEBC9E|nr:MULTISPECIES: DUF3836 domain-containing protein [Parabacteroides]MBC8619816.1 DUF3836 domain-containing protein [Parabacteroides faecis]MCS2890227.1 DUF3836 domain-containing protein [Parabacteroides faecis]RHR37970.1 DUF3836 domain-containing protein [Parabacteroides sp. AF18-52]RHS00624.1 DUF3836 domain-containing protein [Parabacteroides sp. AF14-59]UVQ46080.1 DUF3836 domain-containing protein [Parabacteroides faecis]
MKASILRKEILSLVVLFVCSLAMSAASPRNYLYDTKEENGKIVSKVVFLQEEGLLNKQVKYEFTYNDNGRVAEKKAYRWNKTKETWDPYYLISYQYNEDGNITSEYGMWDKKKKDYSLNQQKMIVPATSYEEIFS